MYITRLFILTCLTLLYSHLAKADWRHESIGSVQYSHYYYEGEELKGICIVSEEGVVALLDPTDGKVVWRNYPNLGRRLTRFLPEGRYAITIIDNYTVSEVFDLKDGKIVNRITLSKDIHRQPFTDIRIINATEGFLKYAIMTNIEINVYENHKIVETIKNPGNMTYVFFDYDKQKKVVVVGSVNDGATEVRVYPADNSQEPFVFAFDPLNDYLLRTWQYVLVVKPPTKTQRFMIVAHKVLGREMLYNDIVKEIGGEFQIKDFLVPSDLVIFRSWKEYAIMVFEELAIKKVQVVSSMDGEYGFGSDQTTSRVYMCHSNQNGYSIYEAQPKKAFRVIYTTETELNRRLYGEPEVMWVDGASKMIILKTSDKSLHLIHNKTKVWTRPFGLSRFSKTFTYEDKLIGITKHSKIFGLDRTTGSVVWERSAIGFVSDFQIMKHQDQPNVALVINSVDVRKTRIAEVTAKEGAKTDYAQAYPEFSTKETRALSDMTESQQDIIMMTSYDNSFAVYPDTEEAKKEVGKYRDRLRFYVFNKTMTKVSGYKVSENISAIEEVWSINFEEKHEMIMAHKESKAKNGPRKSEVSISGKTFKKYPNKYLAIMTYCQADHKSSIYFIDPETGTILASRQLTDKLTPKVPLLSVYDNLAVVALPREGKQDDLVVIELFIAPEMADTASSGKIEKASLEKLVYPIVTNVELKWKLFGLEIMQVDGVDYAVTINDENELKMMDIEKLSRNVNNKAGDENTREIDLPEEMKFVAPITIEYNHKTRTILVHGMDIYSYQLK